MTIILLIIIQIVQNNEFDFPNLLVTNKLQQKLFSLKSKIQKVPFEYGDPCVLKVVIDSYRELFTFFNLKKLIHSSFCEFSTEEKIKKIKKLNSFFAKKEYSSNMYNFTSFYELHVSRTHLVGSGGFS
ncbi:hypothetical protein BpHYR1_050074 [Brachionus plicatilis]|uniref:Uncharacterized protein n=1 Tax=Brachionus plicatilis TaxID=10195 RepID=A0A3M7PNW0_BRAPC|nr:hypothetical protein BpHYR1_050074 [Brachionus plicatilis]